MKKNILTLGLLLATVGLASAQTYPKQPDPTVVNYVPYQKPEPEQEQVEDNNQDQRQDEKKVAETDAKRREEEQPVKEENPDMSKKNTYAGRAY